MLAVYVHHFYKIKLEKRRFDSKSLARTRIHFNGIYEQESTDQYTYIVIYLFIYVQRELFHFDYQEGNVIYRSRDSSPHATLLRWIHLGIRRAFPISGEFGKVS